MNKYSQHLVNRARLIKHSANPLNLLLDSCRMKHTDYQAKHRNGLTFELSGGKGEWFTFFENVVREDYFRGLPPIREGDCIVDIGANIGTFTVVAARRVPCLRAA